MSIEKSTVVTMADVLSSRKTLMAEQAANLEEGYRFLTGLFAGSTVPFWKALFLQFPMLQSILLSIKSHNTNIIQGIHFLWNPQLKTFVKRDSFHLFRITRYNRNNLKHGMQDFYQAFPNSLRGVYFAKIREIPWWNGSKNGMEVHFDQMGSPVHLIPWIPGPNRIHQNQNQNRDRDRDSSVSPLPPKRSSRRHGVETIITFNTIQTIHWCNDLKHGLETTMYRPNSVILAETGWRFGRRDGQSIHRRKTGQVVKMTPYFMGLCHGLEVLLDGKGQARHEIPFVHGRRHGLEWRNEPSKQISYEKLWDCGHLVGINSI